tara:strand:- start:36 stop:374 length:339 start_codon:yes stop_codon:yes gene_type:complete
MNIEEGAEVYSTCGEIFQYEDHEFDVGDSYYSGTVEKLVPSKVMYESIVDVLIEQMEEDVYEECGEASCDTVSMDKDKQEELLCIIKTFVDKHMKIDCFKVVNIEEHVKGEG